MSKLKYGLDPSDIERLLKDQDYRCAICRTAFIVHRPPGKGFRNYRPCVDHCHVTGKVRGLLCQHCNTGIGHFQDNPKLLRRAARYLADAGRGEGSVDV